MSSNQKKSTQATEITGDGNTVHQHIHIHNHKVVNINISEGFGGIAKKAVELMGIDGSILPWFGLNFSKSDTLEGDDNKDVAKILEYREIAHKGDSAAALLLLEQLAKDEKYASGYLAYRLHFNIGIIWQNIGELEKASIALKTAHAYCPENPKAKSGLAFANLLDGNNEQAFKVSAELVEQEGGDVELAACIMFHAASRLDRKVSSDLIQSVDLSDSDVMVAHLEYVKSQHPEEYNETINNAHNGNPNNDAIATMWALSKLDNLELNQANLLGSVLPDDYEKNLVKCVQILTHDLKESLVQTPPNKLLLPSQANNAVVALRLSGKHNDAKRLLKNVLDQHPHLVEPLAEIQATLLIKDGLNNDALETVRPFAEASRLQVMASELEAQNGEETKALSRVNDLLKSDLSDELRYLALDTKARIGINIMNQSVTEEAIEALEANYPVTQELFLLRCIFDRTFSIVNSEELDNDGDRLLATLDKAETWGFFAVMQTADELNARGYFRECVELLWNRTNVTKESPALSTLCHACLKGGLRSLAKELNMRMSSGVKNSAFGWRYGANVAYMCGEMQNAVPLTKKLFEQDSNSINALNWYVQSLLRVNQTDRIKKIIMNIDDQKLSGSLDDKLQYVNLLVFCGEIDRARNYAYRFYCENQNAHKAWMALASSSLALGRPLEISDDYSVTPVQKHTTFEVRKPDGTNESFTIEPDISLLPLREGNIPVDHPIAKAALGRSENDNFDWPFKGRQSASILSVKNKVLAAFHTVLPKFEAQFPEASGFKSVPVNAEQKDGLNDMKAMLAEQAEHVQRMATEYQEGNNPIYVLGHWLGIDPIDALLGMNSESGVPPKVSTGLIGDQQKAARALLHARDAGIIVDSSACFLLRRLGIEHIVEREFGKIGVTQETIDIFSRRVEQAISTSFEDKDTGKRKAGSVAFRNGQIVATELSEEDIMNKIDVAKSDLDWLITKCETLPAVAKKDPVDEILRIQGEDVGRFFDDMYAADRSGRVLISDDLHLRQWAETLFHVRGAWIQALIFHLEAEEKLSIKEVVKASLQLYYIGEATLSTNNHRILAAAEMLSTGELTQDEYNLFCTVIGQPGANLITHVRVATLVIQNLWEDRKFVLIRETATSIILRNLVRLQGENAQLVLNSLQAGVTNIYALTYISNWRLGHFLI